MDRYRLAEPGGPVSRAVRHNLQPVFEVVHRPFVRKSGHRARFEAEHPLEVHSAWCQLEHGTGHLPHEAVTVGSRLDTKKTPRFLGGRPGRLGRTRLWGRAARHRRVYARSLCVQPTLAERRRTRCCATTRYSLAVTASTARAIIKPRFTATPSTVSAASTNNAHPATRFPTVAARNDPSLTRSLAVRVRVKAASVISVTCAASRDGNSKPDRRPHATRASRSSTNFAMTLRTRSGPRP
jgi:hypothetical protein